MIAVVAHDAGGAEILASYVAQRRLECVFSVQGPAARVFERRFGAVESVPVEEAVANGEWLLAGTSWQSDVEWRAFELARRAGKRSVAFLDHWGNFRERFARGGEQHLPDEIWVGDEPAHVLARQCFPELPVTLVPNPYFDDLRRDIAARRQPRAADDGSLRVLFVSEPLREHGASQFGNELHWGYTEFDALRYLLAQLPSLGGQVVSVTARPHPSEPAGKYDWVTAEFGAHVVPGGQRPLLDEIADCEVVAGCESMAMVVGLVAGRRVVCCIPPGGRPCSLPHPEIESLQELARARAN
jgi:hypothetical protein